MKKDNKKLTAAVLEILLAAALTVLSAVGLKAKLNLDTQFGDGDEIVYSVDSTDEAVVRQVSEVLVRRARAFGATGWSVSVEGSTIVLRVAGIEDIDTFRSYSVRTGALTFRNPSDELLMDASVLDADEPLKVAEDSEGSVTLTINVADGDTFGSETLAVAVLSDPTMVLWVDFAEGSDSYESESAKGVPSYLAAARVTSAISGTCYITTHHSLEDAKHMAAIVNSGALPAAVSEASYAAVTAEAGEGALDQVVICLIVSVVLLAAVMISRCGVVPGLVAGGLSALYSAAYFRATELLGLTFNGLLIGIYAIFLGFGIYLTAHTDNLFRDSVQRGRNLTVSIDEAWQQTYRSQWEAMAVMLVGILLAMTAYGSEFYVYTQAALIGIGLDLLVFVVLNKLLSTALFGSNAIANKALYGVKVDQIPDVEKGESYQQPEVKDQGYGALVAGKMPTILFSLLSAGGIVAVFTMDAANRQLAYHTLILAAVILAADLIYTLIVYRSLYLTVFLIPAAAALATGILIVTLFKDAGGTVALGLALVGLVLELGQMLTVYHTFDQAYRQIARQKLTKEKMKALVERTLSGLQGEHTIGLIALFLPLILMTLFLNVYLPASGVCLFLYLFTFYAAGWLGVKLWAGAVVKSHGRRGGKGRRTTEIHERTIYGMNEMKR